MKKLKIPKTELKAVNQRLYCLPLEVQFEEKSGIWLPDSATVTDKKGEVTLVPKFFVVTTAPDLEVMIGIKGHLVPGTQVFPFVPPAERFQFPMIFDPTTKTSYIQFEWMEIGAILLPEHQKEKLWEF